MSSESEQKQRRLEVNWVQTLAGGLAAMSSAVLLSTVGVAGTLIGAALGSIVITVGSAVYSHYLALSRERVATARALALARAYRARADSGVGAGGATATATLVEGVRPDGVTGEGGGTGVDERHPERVSWRDAVKGLPWRRIAPIAAAVFLAVMGGILAFELLTGRTVSSYTGGADADGPRTSLSVFSGGGGEEEQQPDEGAGGGSSSDEGSTEQDGTDSGLEPAGESPQRDTATTPQPEEETAAPEPTAEPTAVELTPTAEPEPTPTAEPTPAQTSPAPAAAEVPGATTPAEGSTP